MSDSQKKYILGCSTVELRIPSCICPFLVPRTQKQTMRAFQLVIQWMMGRKIPYSRLRAAHRGLDDCHQDTCRHFGAEGLAGWVAEKSVKNFSSPFGAQKLAKN